MLPLSYGLKVSTAPAAEPVTLAEMKIHLRVTDVDEDGYITELIQEARQFVENSTGRAIYDRSYTLNLHRGPAAMGLTEVILPRPPLDSITSVNYIDVDGNSQAWTDYQVSTSDEWGRLKPDYNTSWPSVREQYDCFTVVYVAGYGTATSDFPLPLVRCMKLITGNWFENREAATPVMLRPVPMAAESIINNYKAWAAA